MERCGVRLLKLYSLAVMEVMVRLHTWLSRVLHGCLFLIHYAVVWIDSILVSHALKVGRGAGSSPQPGTESTGKLSRRLCVSKTQGYRASPIIRSFI
jgi:hypothetical protein